MSSNLVDQQDYRTMEARVGAFLFHRCDMQRLGLRTLTPEFWQEFFSQVSRIDDKLDGNTIRKFIHPHVKNLTEEMFSGALADRMNLLFILRPYVYYLCYVARLSYFSGLAFDIESIRGLTGRYSEAIDLALRTHSYRQAEVVLTEQFNTNVEYILLDINDSNYLSRYLHFANRYPDIVVLNMEQFWRYTCREITREDLDNLPEQQVRDIPAVYRTTLGERFSS